MLHSVVDNYALFVYIKMCKLGDYKVLSISHIHVFFAFKEDGVLVGSGPNLGKAKNVEITRKSKIKLN